MISSYKDSHPDTSKKRRYVLSVSTERRTPRENEKERKIQCKAARADSAQDKNGD